MIRPVVIYCLKDPRDNSVKYIGKTSNVLKQRLCAHISEAKRARRKNLRYSWIIGLLSKNLKPIIELIEECENNEIASERETYYIEHYKKLGIELKNMQPGGDGQPPGYKFKKRYVPEKGKTPEHLKKYPHPSKLPNAKEIYAKMKRKPKGYEVLKTRKIVYLKNILTEDIIQLDSVKAAANFLNTTPPSISGRCHNKIKGPINNFLCSFENNFSNIKVFNLNKKIHKVRRDVVEYFDSIKKASKSVGIDRKTLGQLLKTKKEDRYGYKWYYTSESY